ncbi:MULTISPECIES: methionine biosynthesis protein MetW [Bombella]|uniref:Methionine biosynthesis protein MetW n=1 Tax=Bombella pollinis TaxID=2967337 RepID=A0ABT3WMG0_9PROT|nr:MULTISPECIES: methionine biosynthesis protein MetW [Bombella]MCT6855069.1 methionine biosynthesis protein MetW [Bombella apis]MCX5619459.1 methionine biosynthesis protein MetW [Bombella pollinis]MUG04931.1 methionine biosynthesis protein MetW [Bombella sp. ESL0378]MUG90480.1 methionine biosynthesis protein MetW [Bombella sp. ESL0385]
MRFDQELIATMVAPQSRVLDIGSGDGSLIDYLSRQKGCDAQGLELDMKAVTQSVAHGLPVMHGDADEVLADYPEDTFDYVVLQRTLQAVERPREVLHHMLRIGRAALVSFPNFGHWRLRWHLMRTGRMPMTSVWPTPWYETSNIHPCTIYDFFALCAEDGYVVRNWMVVNGDKRSRLAEQSPHLANMFGEQALFLLQKQAR